MFSQYVASGIQLFMITMSCSCYTLMDAAGDSTTMEGEPKLRWGPADSFWNNFKPQTYQYFPKTTMLGVFMVGTGVVTKQKGSVGWQFGGLTTSSTLCRWEIIWLLYVLFYLQIIPM